MSTDPHRHDDTPAPGAPDDASDLRHLHPDHIEVGDTAVFAGLWAWEDRGQGERIPVGFVGTLIDRWNGWAVFRCSRQVAAEIVIEQDRLREAERRLLQAAGCSGADLAAAVDEAFAPMAWDGDQIVVDERVTYGDAGIIRIDPDVDGQYVVKGWAWTWTVVAPDDCDRIAGRPPTRDEQPPRVTLPHSGLRVPHTRIAVTGVALPHIGPDVPQLSPASSLVAVLSLDGNLAGVADTDGREPLRYHPVPRSRLGSDQLGEFVAECRRRGQPVTVDTVLRCLAEEYHLTTQAHRAAAHGNTLVRLTDASGRTLVIESVPTPADDRARHHLAETYARKTARSDGRAWEILIPRGWALLTPASR
ncbi:hypothetical protein C1I95_23640 [Micromonospora craterilacus]|uniref:Uncharacterized protein n=1 Tax=Micromonospora craterilacus TaxID=1655439 RepID=A0A2W2E9Q8_9ACTN|nr:hypothetical protein [Micromonospora craterilacus]PZG13449.1 hypothetical protein C1I95_23640 [Micromonospora craterilacus]